MSRQFLSCKSLRLNSDVKCAARQVIEICIHNCEDSQIGQGTANDTTRNIEHFRCGLFWGNIVRRIFFQPTKSQICQNEHASMVGLQFIDLWHAPDEIIWSHKQCQKLANRPFCGRFPPRTLCKWTWWDPTDLNRWTCCCSQVSQSFYLAIRWNEQWEISKRSIAYL